MSHSPCDFGLERTRWSLGLLLILAGRWLNVTSEAGLWHALQRLGIRYRQGGEHMVSPAPLKLSYISAVLHRAHALPDRVVVLWLDELTFYRLPDPAPCWSDGRARPGPKARKTRGANTKGRIGAALNHLTGQVIYLLRPVPARREP